MRLARLAALERKKIEDEYLAVIQLIAELEDLLANPARVLAIIKDELTELKRKYAGERRTRVVDDSSREITDEDLIADEDVVVTITHRGYVKRLPVATYRRQHRGGKGIIGHVTREEDAVEHLLVANTHDWALFFTNRGRVFSARSTRSPMRAARPRASRSSTCPASRWSPARSRSRRSPCRTSSAGSLPRPGDAHGIIKKTPLEQFEKVRSTGIRAITIDDDDELAWVDVSLGRGRHHHRHAHRARSPASTRPRSGRWAATPAGVIGIRLARKGDAVVSMSVVQPDADLLVLTETGYGKRVPLTEFRRQASRRPGRRASSRSRAARPATWRRSSRSPSRTRSCS